MKIYNLIILDESGSMDHIKQAAIDSVNETLQSIRGAQKENEGQEHFVSFVSFNSSVKTIFDCVSADSVNDLTGRDYEPSGLTALYDAMGISLTALRQRVQSDDKVLVTIVTDGMENASHTYSSVRVKEMIKRQTEKYGWEFIFVAANIDAVNTAENIGIRRDRAANYRQTKEGVSRSYYAMSEAITSVRCDCADKMNLEEYLNEEADET